ncbi:putative quinol monooxygenase [Microbacterium sp. NPDC091313]
MSVTVVAVLTAKPGRVEEILAAFAEVSPLVHREQGCEFYAAHRQQDGDAVVMVERWDTRADLDAHAAGDPLARLNESLADVLARPYDVWFLDPVPLGDEVRGRLSEAVR